MESAIPTVTEPASADDEALTAADTGRPGTVHSGVGQVASVLPLLVGSTALAAALAFYMGREYQRGYLSEWGLPYSAFSFTPYELMVSSSQMIVAAILFGSVLTMNFFGDDARDFFFSIFLRNRGKQKVPSLAEMSRSDRLLRLIWGLVGVSAFFGFFGYVLVDAIITDSPSNVILPVMTIMFLVFWLASGQLDQKGARALVIGVTMALVIFFVIVLPGRLGAERARQERRHLEVLPRVEFVLAHPLGTKTERVEPQGLVSGPWRVIIVNEGRYWLIKDDERATEIVQISEAAISSVRYLPEE